MRLVATLSLLALVLAACGSGSDSPAALTVGSSTIDQETVNEELAAIATNKSLEAQVATKGKIRPEAAATWITQLVPMEVARAIVEDAGTDISKADTAEAKEWASGVFGEAAFADFSKSFREQVLDRYANIPAYVRTHTKEPTEAEVRSAYDDGLAENCASRRYVSHILVATEEEAKAAAALLASGTAFEEVASGASTDQQTASAGGAYGCLDRLENAPTFAEAAAATPIGQVSAPIQLLDGWHIIKVQDVEDVVTFKTAKPEIISQLRGQEGRRKLAALVVKAKVKVAPRYGTWVVEDGQGRIDPPVASTTTSSTPGDASTTTTTSP